jgi:hypothetical protein
VECPSRANALLRAGATMSASLAQPRLGPRRDLYVT